MIPGEPEVDALVRTMKDVELLTVEAAVHGDDAAAMRALAAHPLGPRINWAGELWRRRWSRNGAPRLPRADAVSSGRRPLGARYGTAT